MFKNMYIFREKEREREREREREGSENEISLFQKIGDLLDQREKVKKCDTKMFIIYCFMSNFQPLSNLPLCVSFIVSSCNNFISILQSYTFRFFKALSQQCSELVYTVVNELLAILYYSNGPKSYLLVTQFPRIYDLTRSDKQV